MAEDAPSAFPFSSPDVTKSESAEAPRPSDSLRVPSPRLWVIGDESWEQEESAMIPTTKLMKNLMAQRKEKR